MGIRGRLCRGWGGGLAAMVLLLLLLPTQTAAETITWRMRNDYLYSVQVEFYAAERAAAWPGEGKAYQLEGDQVHSFRLDCHAGEKICFGAWVAGNADLYWGAGLDGLQSCGSCCYLCAGEFTPIIALR